jgi:hypothetical protein
MEQKLEKLVCLLEKATSEPEPQPVHDPGYLPNQAPIEEPEPVQPQQALPEMSPFYEQLIDQGEAAVLNNPRIMNAIDERFAGFTEYQRAQQELAGPNPEAYDGNSPVGQTRIAIRKQLADMGVPANMLNSRMFEELAIYSAMGKNFGAIVDQRTKAQQERSERFVEGGNGTPISSGSYEEVTADTLSDDQVRTAQKLGVDPVNYAKNLNKLVSKNVIERR